MNNEEINTLKIKINDLENKIKEAEEAKKAASEKCERARSGAVTCTCISMAGHFVGFFINPVIVLGSLVNLLITVAPLGIMTFHYEDKQDKYQKNIDAYKKEINEAKEEINFLSNIFINNMSSIKEKSFKSTIQNTRR